MTAIRRESRRRAHLNTREHDRESEAGKHDPDIFNGRIGQQTFHVGLCGGENDPIQSAEEPERQRQQSPPPYGLTHEVKTYPDHSVQRCLQHDAAHQRRDRRRRGGMRFRQPHMQRHQACLGAKSNQRETESDCRPIGSEVRGTHGIEGEMPAPALKNTKAQQNGDCTQVGHQADRESRPGEFQECDVGW